MSGSGGSDCFTWWFGAAPFVLLLGLRGSAQIDEFLPEIDVYYKVSRDVRVTFQAKETREGGDPTQAEIGPSIAFYLTPLVRLKRVTVFDLNDEKSRPLVLSIGYRYLPSPASPSVNRVEPVENFHFPIKAGFLLTDRNRADPDWKTGKFSWCYRNRLQIERRFAIFSYHPAPYASVEFFYQSQYKKWSDTAKSKDFFDVNQDPLITFHSDKVVQIDPTTLEMPGTFTIRGVSKPETLTFTVTGKGTGSGEIKGTMAFDRKDYGMNKGIPFIKIADRVEVTVDLKGKRVSGPPLVFKP